MIFPIGDDNIEGGFKPLVAYSLLVFNGLIFFYELTLTPPYLEAFLNHYGSIPIEIVAGDDLFTLLTSMFLHGGWMHVIGNMLFLWIFADNIEAVIGNLHFLIFYIAGGLFASATHILFNLESGIPSIGASGAISAVMGAYLIMFPKSRIKVLFILIFSTFTLSAFTFLIIWFIQQLFSGIGALSLGMAQNSGVAWWAHIGGFVFGLVLGLFFKRRYGHRYSYASV